MAKKSRRPEWKIGRRLKRHELARYGIDEETASAVRSSAEVALECVRRAPELHIISMMKAEKYYFYNRYVPNADSYYLSDGDPNPELSQIEELLCGADIDELEEAFRESSGGELCPFDQGMFRFFRMLMTNTFSLDALVDPEHRWQVRAMELEEAKWKRDEDPELPQSRLLKKA